jgi:hypothetical protein
MIDYPPTRSYALAGYEPTSYQLGITFPCFDSYDYEKLAPRNDDKIYFLMMEKGNN